MIDKLSIDDVPENLKGVACAIGIDAFRNLIKCAGGTSLYLPSIRCISKPVRDRLIRESFCGDYREMALRFGISEVSVRKIVSKKS
ncbi:Mor transcription activator family protein [Romboutsia sp. 13368]|uniref:Mor transcription activator family protein n=1 Tax=Romboutsia sp. 13368 TaxID=2708053 RepID=UPI0025F9230E|nr:Mor transcription activator family protein [Romboutsia sp. 13368]